RPFIENIVKYVLEDMDRSKIGMSHPKVSYHRWTDSVVGVGPLRILYQGKDSKYNHREEWGEKAPEQVNSDDDKALQQKVVTIINNVEDLLEKGFLRGAHMEKYYDDFQGSFAQLKQMFTVIAVESLAADLLTDSPDCIVRIVSAGRRRMV